jgi:hypothetical protein
VTHLQGITTSHVSKTDIEKLRSNLDHITAIQPPGKAAFCMPERAGINQGAADENPRLKKTERSHFK